MPDGVMMWFDPRTGEGEVVRAGRLFAARVADIDPAARRAGARVHFDIRRDNGADRAVSVELREGTRVSHHQRRFGTLAGAKHFDTKGPAPYVHTHPEVRAGDDHPLELAMAWATSVARGEIDSAVALYSPDALIHAGGEVLVGRAAGRAWMEQSPPFGSGRLPRIHGTDGTVAVSWDVDDPREAGTVVRSRIAHGQIAEQWLEEPEHPEALSLTGRAANVEVAIATKGEVGDDAKDRAKQALASMLDKIEEPVLSAKIRLVWEPDPARPRRAVAKVNLDIDGELVRVHVAAPTMPEAIDRLFHRLDDRLEHRFQYRQTLHRWDGVAHTSEWRHGDLATLRPDYFDRSTEDRQLVRHKTFEIGELTPEEAAFDMEQLDYDFHLFQDLASGSDSVLERTEDGKYRLTRLVPSGTAAAEAGWGLAQGSLEVSDTPAPVLTFDEAIERLNAGGERYVFFANARTGRGNILYRRYDGHYGVITPE